MWPVSPPGLGFLRVWRGRSAVVAVPGGLVACVTCASDEEGVRSSAPAFTRKRQCRTSDRLAPMAASGEPVGEGTLELDDGRALGYAEYGQPDGAPIVYLHGMPGSRLDPAALDEEYRQLGARVVALERPG